MQESRPADDTAPPWERTYTRKSTGCRVPQRCSMSVRFEIALNDYTSFYGFGFGINVEPAHRSVGVCPTCGWLQGEDKHTVAEFTVEKDDVVPFTLTCGRGSHPRRIEAPCEVAQLPCSWRDSL